MEDYNEWINCNVLCDTTRRRMADKDETPLLDALAAFLDVLGLVKLPGNALMHGYSELIRQLSRLNRKTAHEQRSRQSDLFHRLNRLEMDHADEHQRKSLREELQVVAEESCKTVIPVEVGGCELEVQCAESHLPHHMWIGMRAVNTPTSDPEACPMSAAWLLARTQQKQVRSCQPSNH